MKTSSTLVALSLSLVTAAGCAATASERGGDSTAPRAGVALELTVTETATAPSFPARLSRPATPAAGLAHRVATQLDGRARADLRLCVGGDGAVTSAALVQSSGITALDAAFVADARTWRYQPLAVSSATACQKIEIAYSLR